MLRISKLNRPDAVTLQLEGKVVRDWTSEVRRIWLGISGGTKVIVDLTEVWFVDEHGRELLEQMYAGGAKLVGSGPMIAALIEEIQSERPAAKQGRLQQAQLFLSGLLLALAKI